MAQTDTQTKEQARVAPQMPESTPPAAPEMKDEERSGKFSDVLITRIDDIAPLLPAHVKKERFIAAAHAAVKQNPELLDCTQRSLFNALTKAAQDGLLPDGREGVITSYNTQVEHNGKKVYAKMASWNPMVYGLRKRAREIDGIIIDAQVVHEKDHFIWHQGDDPKIEHQPKLGSERGPMIGVYAIFKRENGLILHREVMDKDQVMSTKNQSRAKTSLMWTTFETEGWRKAVVRRGVKTVPVSEALETIITRDDENFDFERAAPALALTPPPAPPVAPVIAQKAPEPPAPPPANTGNPEMDAYDDWKHDAYAELDACTSIASVEDMRDRLLSDLKDEDKAAWKDACADKATALFKAK